MSSYKALGYRNLTTKGLESSFPHVSSWVVLLLSNAATAITWITTTQGNNEYEGVRSTTSADRIRIFLSDILSLVPFSLLPLSSTPTHLLAFTPTMNGHHPHLTTTHPFPSRTYQNVNTYSAESAPSKACDYYQLSSSVRLIVVSFRVVDDLLSFVGQTQVGKSESSPFFLQ